MTKTAAVAAIYVRCSRPDQRVEVQLAPLRLVAERRGFTAVREYVDAGISGSRRSRPALDSLLADARRGELAAVFVAAFDRVARSVTNLLELVDELARLRVELVSTREGFDTASPLGRAMLQVGGVFAELERGLLIERTELGLDAARARGVRLGRPEKLDPRSRARAARLVLEGGKSVRQAAKLLDCSRTPVARAVERARERDRLLS